MPQSKYKYDHINADGAQIGAEHIKATQHFLLSQTGKFNGCIALADADAAIDLVHTSGVGWCRSARMTGGALLCGRSPEFASCISPVCIVSRIRHE